MSMMEKFNEYKKATFEKFDEARDAYKKAMDSAADEFVENFVSLVENASSEEFIDFVFRNNELSEKAKHMAIAIRLEHYANSDDEKPNERKRERIVIIGME